MKQIVHNIKLMKRMVMIASLVLMCVLLFSGCTPKVKSMRFNTNSNTILIDESFTLTLKIEPEKISVDEIAISWTTSDPTVATVINGTVKGIGVGTASISAKSENGVECVCYVTVTKPSAYSQLDADDKQLTDAIISYAKNNFLKPSSAQLSGVYSIQTYDIYTRERKEILEELYIVLKGENGFGGISEGAFEYDPNGGTLKEEDSIPTIVVIHGEILGADSYVNHNYDMSKINAALREKLAE